MLHRVRNACPKIESTKILNVSSQPRDVMNDVYKALKIETKHLQLGDLPLVNMLEVLQDAHSFIEEAVQNKQHVLVHCVEGKNRSAAVVVSYYMKRLASNRKHPWRNEQEMLELFHEALRCIAKDRWPILSNQSFRLQLILWALHKFDAVKAAGHPLCITLRCQCCIHSHVCEHMLQSGFDEDSAQKCAHKIMAKLWRMGKWREFFTKRNHTRWNEQQANTSLQACVAAYFCKPDASSSEASFFGS